MAHLVDQVIAVISKPPATRSDVEVSNIITWLRRRTELLPQLDKETQMEVLRFCSYETAGRDDVVLRQGEEGYCMYIILRGSISVYIDASLTGEDPDLNLSPANSPTRQQDSPDTSLRRKHALERGLFGKFIIKYETGKSFGEAALVGDDKTRNATVIADEDCDFLVIDQPLFDRCLKTYQQKEYRAMQKFVETHPYFSHMSPKFKRLLELSLRRENFAFDSPIVTQGQPCTALYFIIRTEAPESSVLPPGGRLLQQAIQRRARLNQHLSELMLDSLSPPLADGHLADDDIGDHTHVHTGDYNSNQSDEQGRVHFPQTSPLQVAAGLTGLNGIFDLPDTVGRRRSVGSGSSGAERVPQRRHPPNHRSKGVLRQRSNSQDRTGSQWSHPSSMQDLYLGNDPRLNPPPVGEVTALHSNSRGLRPMAVQNRHRQTQAAANRLKGRRSTRDANIVLEGNGLDNLTLRDLLESRKNAILRKYEDPAVLPTKPDSLVVRRQEGYAASERMMQERQVCLCSVQDGEVIGDTEHVQNLATYLQTVVCTTDTQVLVLDVKNLERVTGRRNMQTLEIMKEHVRNKMDTRRASKYGQLVPFLDFLYAKLTEEMLPEAKKLPPLKTSKTLPSRDTQMQHLLERYLDGKAELVEPCVPGTLIYKDLMEEKARVRANIRRRGTIGVGAMLRDARRKMYRRKPRSRREIVESLKEMMEAELVEVSPDQPGQPNAKRKGSTQQTPAASTSPSQQSKSRFLPPIAAGGGVSETDTTPSRRSSLTKDPPSRKSSLTNETSPRRSSLTADPSPRKSSLTKDSDPKVDAAKKKRVTLPPLVDNNNNSRGSQKKADTKDKTPSANPLITLGSDSRRMSRAGGPVDPALPQIMEEKEDTPVTQASPAVLDSAPSNASSAQSRYVKREVQATSEGPTPPSGSAKRLPPLAKVEIRRPEHVPFERWDQALKFVNERIHDRFTTQLLEAGAELNDYETSEGSMQLLESRIKHFHVKYSDYSPVKLNLKLPKLRRFKLDIEDETQRLPKPGGKVWIKKRICQFANSKLKVKGHQHIRYHMVPELPEFDNVKKMQRVMQSLMDSSVRRNQNQDTAASGGAAGTSSAPAPPPENLTEHRASFVDETLAKRRTSFADESLAKRRTSFV